MTQPKPPSGAEGSLIHPERQCQPPASWEGQGGARIPEQFFLQEMPAPPWLDILPILAQSVTNSNPHGP